MKKVSVIIPIYNQEAFLEKSLPSVMNQSYHNLEIICVNDGSTDHSGEILEAYKRVDDRIVVITQENGGLVYAVAQGVRKCTGEYICFLDSDDYLDLDFISTAISEIGTNDFIAYSHYIDNGKSIIENSVDADIMLDIPTMKLLRNNLVWDEKKKKLSKSILNSRWNKVYKSECVKAFVDLYDSCKNISFGEDTLFTFLLLAHSKTGIVKKKAIGYYYNTGNSSSMMSEGTINAHIDKAKKSLCKFNQLEELFGENSSQPLAMYFFLIESLFQRLEYNTSKKAFRELFLSLRKDKNYKTALDYLIKHSTGRRKAVFICRRYIRDPRLYELLFLITKSRR